MQRLGQQSTDATESQVPVPEMKVAAGEGRVCPAERRHRAASQEESAGCFQVCEVLERPNESLYRRVGFVPLTIVHDVTMRLLAGRDDDFFAFDDFRRR